MRPHLARRPRPYHDALAVHGTLNLLKGAIVVADRITTVSPTYAREIRTARYGHDLEHVLRWLSPKLIGILNGIDAESWNPATDRALGAAYSASDPEGKLACRDALRFELGGSRRVGRRSSAWCRGSPPRRASTGSARSRPSWCGRAASSSCSARATRPSSIGCYWAAQRLRGSVVYVRAFDDGLARRIYAGSDMFLMPSRFEPCGLAQMYSMRYGTVPVARATGGLVDTIAPLHNRHDVGGSTGILYEARVRRRARRTRCGGASSSWRARGAHGGPSERDARRFLRGSRAPRQYLEMYRDLGVELDLDRRRGAELLRPRRSSAGRSRRRGRARAAAVRPHTRHRGERDRGPSSAG